MKFKVGDRFKSKSIPGSIVTIISSISNSEYSCRYSHDGSIKVLYKAGLLNLYAIGYKLPDWEIKFRKEVKRV